MDGIVLNADCLRVLREMPNCCVDMALCSPPFYRMRDYGVEGQIGWEATPQEYIERLCNVFDQVKRVLKPTGTCWVNLGDTHGPRGLLQIPSRFAIEMAERGWHLPNEIVWKKTKCMPSSAKRRFTVDFEKLFFFTKSKDYYFEQQFEPLAESSIGRAKYRFTSARANNRQGVHVEKMGDRFCSPKGRNTRSVWSITPNGFDGEHFATFPEALCALPIRAGCPIGGVVLDVFAGSGTSLVVSKKLGRRYVGIELNPDYCKIIEKRLKECSFLRDIRLGKSSGSLIN